MLKLPRLNNTNTGTVEMLPKAKVKFKKPLLVEDVVKLKDKNKVKLKQIDSELIVGDSPTYGIYNVDLNPNQPSITTKTATELESYIKKERLAYFADMVAGENNLSVEERAELKPQLDVMKAALKNRDAGSVRVTQATFSGEPLNLQQLSQDANAEKVDVEDKEFIKKENQKLKLPTSEESRLDQHKPFLKVPRLIASLNPAPLLAQTTSSTWYPNSGRSEIGQSANAANERYTKQYMRWNANRFGASQTYEHEFFLDDYDYHTYLYKYNSHWPDCMPGVTSVQSTWGSAARPYLDTRLEQPGQGFCESGELGYVVGAAQANRISSGVTHHTYIRTYNGGTSSDRFFLRAQLGHRSPNDCFTTWCSFGDARLTLVPQWSVNVPGVKDWVRP